jgi:muramoyltetrapeptide carboxypeptidase LdcA involved in peptidoglycan recycling
MERLIPSKLQPGDTVRVIAPSRSLAIIGQGLREVADRRLHDLGLHVTFGRHVEEMDELGSIPSTATCSPSSSSPDSRGFEGW